MKESGAKVDDENFVVSTNAWNIVAAVTSITPSQAAVNNKRTTDNQNIFLRGPRKS
tara:strand:+ start:288 stop:455 length:168 start_codon:yes stop_codon:yes gene_type:complete